MVETVIMEGNAEAQDLWAEWPRQRKMTLRTPRDQTAARPQMMTVLQRPTPRRRRQPRGQTVAPLHGGVHDICARDRCWMRGHRHHRWLLAAMGGTVPRHQARALKRRRSGRKITQEVFGL